MIKQTQTKNIMPVGTKLTLEHLRTFEQFCALQPEWDDLAKSQVKTIFLTHFWLKEWWRNFGMDHQMWILLARENGRLVGILPLMLVREKYGVRILKFIGTGEVTPNHLDVIATEQSRSAVIPAFINHLSHSTSEWDVLELDKIPGDSPNLMALRTGLQTQGSQIRFALSASCPYSELPNSFETFLGSRSRKTQEGFRYSKRRVAREFPDHYLGAVQSPKQVQVVMAALMELHQKRWLKKGYTGVFASQRLVNFHFAVANQALQHEQLRLYFLQFSNEIDAVIYCFRVADFIQYYLGGFNEKWAKYSPGNIINSFAIERAIIDGASRFDFLEGEETYKKQWMTDSRDDFILMVFRPNLRGQIYRIRLVLKDTFFRVGTRVVPQRIRRPFWKLYLKLSARNKKKHSTDSTEGLFHQ